MRSPTAGTPYQPLETAHLKMRGLIHNPFNAPTVGTWMRSYIFTNL
ncbi:MAG: hypothetical protein QXH67_07325 [Candidatus Bathyarchaeia archaeon]